MNLPRYYLMLVALFGFAVLLSGCSASKETRIAELEQQLQESNSRIGTIQTELQQTSEARAQAQTALEARQRELEAAERAAVEAEARAASSREMSAAPAPTGASSGAMDLLPPNAKPGECYARVYLPAKFENKTERVVKKEASTRITTVPAVFENVTERVMVAEESEEVVEVAPAQFETRTERIEIKPASFRLEPVAAVYETMTERVLVKEAQKVWKPSQGRIYGSAVRNDNGELVTQVNAQTGEVMCLVEVPAEYKTVTKRVLKSPATTRRIEIPGEYKTVTRTVMVKAPELRTVKVPARYETVTKRRLVTPAQERVIEIPAEYETLTQTVQTGASQLTWMPVLCEVNVTRETVAELQRRLQSAGHYRGPIDGIYGSQTIAGIESYQRANSLARGGLTTETLEKLNMSY